MVSPKTCLPSPRDQSRGFPAKSRHAPEYAERTRAPRRMPLHRQRSRCGGAKAESYRQTVERIIRAAAFRGQVVIVGTGLPGDPGGLARCAARSRHCPFDQRVAYVMQREAVDHRTAEARIHRKEQARARYLERMYHHHPLQARLCVVWRASRQLQGIFCLDYYETRVCEGRVEGKRASLLAGSLPHRPAAEHAFGTERVRAATRLLPGRRRETHGRRRGRWDKPPSGIGRRAMQVREVIAHRCRRQPIPEVGSACSGHSYCRTTGRGVGPPSRGAGGF